MDLQNKIEELVDGHQTVPYQPGALFWGVNCLVMFPSHFNPNNSHLILKYANAAMPLLEKWPEKNQALNGIQTHDLYLLQSLQISLLFICTPALTALA